MPKINDYKPISNDNGKTWMIKSLKTGETIYHNGRPAKFNTKNEAQIEANFQNKSFGGKLWAFIKNDPVC